MTKVMLWSVILVSVALRCFEPKRNPEQNRSRTNAKIPSNPLNLSSTLFVVKRKVSGFLSRAEGAAGGDMRCEGLETRRVPSANIGVISRLKRHINKIACTNKSETAAMFVTRDVLYCGKRAAVDSALFRLVRSGDLIRLARGVFIPSKSGIQLPTAIEIVQAKARAFNRSIFRHAADVAAELGLTAAGNEKTVFATDGGNSSFFIQAYGNRVQLRNVCPRKRDSSDSVYMQAVRAVWLACKPFSGLDERERQILASRLGRENWDRFLACFRVMPAWLWDNVEHYARYSLYRLEKQVVPPRVGEYDPLASYGGKIVVARAPQMERAS